MNQEQLNKANVDNLTNMWKHFGATTIQSKNKNQITANNGWPSRVWWEWDQQPVNGQASAIFSQIDDLSRDVVLPIWEGPQNGLEQSLEQNHFAPLFQQTAMVLPLENTQSFPESDLLIKEIESQEDVDSWVEVASKGFGYQFDRASIQKIVGNPQFKIVLAFLDQTPVGTGIMFEDSGVAGIHMVAVSPDQRKKGIARKIMHHLLNVAREAQIPFATLQASDMGEPLYLQLGFEKQFSIHNYSNFSMEDVKAKTN